MKNNNNNDLTSKIGNFLHTIITILIVLKLTKVINISWVLIFSPIIVCFGLSVILLAIGFIAKKMQEK